MGTLSGLGLQLMAMLLLMGGIAFVLVRLGRHAQGPKQGPLELVARMPLEGRRSVYLLRAGKRMLVVGSSESGLSSLGTFDAGDLESSIDVAGASASPAKARSVAELEERSTGVSAAELLGHGESPVPPRSMWRRDDGLEDGDVEVEAFAVSASRAKLASSED